MIETIEWKKELMGSSNMKATGIAIAVGVSPFLSTVATAAEIEAVKPP